MYCALIFAFPPFTPQVNFVKEFCAFSQTLQPQNRDAFYKTLANLGILPALEIVMVWCKLCLNIHNVLYIIYVVYYESMHILPATVFPVVQGMDDLQVRAAAIDIFSYLVEFSPSMVREFVMQEPQQAEDVSINIHSSRSIAEFIMIRSSLS